MCDQLKRLSTIGFGKADVTSSQLVTDTFLAELMSANPQPVIIFNADDPESFPPTLPETDADREFLARAKRAQNAIEDLRPQIEAFEVWRPLPAPGWLRRFWRAIWDD